MSRRRVYPLLGTAEIKGRERQHTIVLDGVEVEIDGREVDELPDLIDDSPERVLSGQRRRARVAPSRVAYAEALASGGAERTIDPFDDD